MNIQYSRGCPFNCEFCNITSLYGRVPRTKDSGQLIAELEKIYSLGWREGVFFVDDNFIGNKKKLKDEVLPSLIQWMEERGRPFYFSTEASINLADDEELMRMMARAEFITVFVGIETPHEESLIECAKAQNRNRDLIASVKKIQDFGLEVQAGFIVGFDQDPASIFEKMIAFIQESGIVTAMVGLLNAPRGTKLYERLVKENRMLKTSTGDNTDLSMNFVPKMSYEKLIKGYRHIIETIYSPKHYYRRVKGFMKDYRPMQTKGGTDAVQLLEGRIKVSLHIGGVRKGALLLLETRLLVPLQETETPADGRHFFHLRFSLQKDIRETLQEDGERVK